jgi:ankyrin repeat protein
MQLGNSALHLAALGAHLDVMKLLLEHNADVNGINDEGNTALILSTICMADSASDCARLLIESKADPEIQNLPSENGGGGGCRALHYACGEGNMPIVQYLVEEARVELRAVSKDVLTPLLCAMINNRANVAAFLIRSDPGCALCPIRRVSPATLRATTHPLINLSTQPCAPQFIHASTYQLNPARHNLSTHQLIISTLRATIHHLVRLHTRRHG